MLAVLCWIICAVLGNAGVVIALRARKRRAGAARHCARCEYNLTGLPCESNRCPECGSNLGAANSVLIGDAFPSRIQFSVGTLLALGAVAVALLAGSTSVRNFDPIPHLPAGILAMRAEGTDPSRVTPALQELIRRIKAGSLSRERIDALVARGLAHQGNHAQPWNNLWGELIETARSAKQISPQDWDTYLGQAFAVDFSIPRYAKGRPGVPIELMLSARLSPRTTLSAQLYLAACIGEQTSPAFRFYDVRVGWNGSFTGANPNRVLVSPPTSAYRPGEYPVQIRAIAEFMDRTLVNSVPTNQPISTTLFTSGKKSVHLLGHDQPLPARQQVVDPVLRDAVANSLRFSIYRDPTYPIRVELKLTSNPPVGLAMKLTLRSKDAAWPSFSVFIPRGTLVTTTRYFNVPLDVQTADLVLEPDPTAEQDATSGSALAIDALLTDAIWGEPIVVKNAALRPGRVSAPLFPELSPSFCGTSVPLSD